MKSAFALQANIASLILKPEEAFSRHSPTQEELDQEVRDEEAAAEHGES